MGMTGDAQLMIPITQRKTSAADTLGLSLVHTNKTLKRLSALKLIRWHDRACEALLGMDSPGSDAGRAPVERLSPQETRPLI